uniref:AP complex subunit beta n=2 Tax=Rhizochromulina marina TaxID=1034831 RepID=A0A7S2WFD7_9STRA
MSLPGSRKKDAGGGDGRFFTTTKKGEVHELRMEINSPNREKKMDAVKKVIANMTVGKDVSSLFTDVVNCIQTNNIELKKLVYLYLINYAKTQPETALLAVNTFVKDANDPNPLIRALAVRTMGCIRVERITEYLCEPLQRCLSDDDPYVRKTAAICVAKLHDIAPDMVEERGFLEMLRDRVGDSNPTVVANAIAALNEIQEASGRDVMMMTTSVLQKLLAALNECTEWGQVFILDALAKYTPANGQEAEGIIERVTPRLQHANSAVVMSAVKIVLSYMDLITSEDTVRQLSRKLAPPLVTLLNSEAEIQFVALRNINLIVQKRPQILEHEIKVFFCKYNDPIYVKMEKLEIIIRLVNERNIEQVLLEFKEYATEVDVDFVRRSVRAIGRCAIKLERAAQRCINVLLELIQLKVDYIVQEAVIVTKDIFRRYPGKYEQIISTLCENLETLDEPEAKASMIWIVGEYADQIDNAEELLDSFLEAFEEEPSQVQLQLLTATVKLFLKQPAESQEMVQRVLQLATEESDNPDLRDRGYVYWRLLSSNPEAAKAVVLAEKPNIADDTFALEPELLQALIGDISTLASIYHKPASAFVMKASALDAANDEEEEEEEEYYDEDSSGVAPGGAAGAADAAAAGGQIDLLDMGGHEPAPVAAPVAGGAEDLLGVLGGAAAAPGASTGFPAQAKALVCPAATGQGVQISAAITSTGPGQIALELDISNQTQGPLQNLALQFNKNSFGLVPANASVNLPAPIMPGASAPYTVPLSATPQMLAPGEPTTSLQIAVKNMHTQAVFIFPVTFQLFALFKPSGLDTETFKAKWSGIDPAMTAASTVSPLPGAGDVPSMLSACDSKLQSVYATQALTTNTDGVQRSYYSVSTVTNATMLLELSFKAGFNGCKISVRCEQQQYAALLKAAVEALLR